MLKTYFASPLLARVSRMSVPGAAAALLLALVGVPGAMALAQEASETPSVLIVPGDKRLTMPDLADYEARYTSAFSKTGEFSLTLRLHDGGERFTLIDNIPTEKGVVLASRVIERKTGKLLITAGPYQAFGPEYLVGVLTPDGYGITRVPLSGAAAVHLNAKPSANAAMSDMFSPLLASLLPLEKGMRFRLPALEPVRGGEMEIRPSSYEVVGNQTLDLGAGLGCNCTIIDKHHPDGSRDRFFVERKAPYVFAWVRDFGGKREFRSNLKRFEFKSSGVEAPAVKPDPALFDINWQENPAVEMKDFDPMEGRWTLYISRLEKRMAGSREWKKWTGQLRYVNLLPGLAGADQISGTLDGTPYHATNLKTFDPASGEWVISWMADFHPQLAEQVRGRFNKGVGIFYGRESYAGRSYKMRWRSQMISDDLGYWDQSFQDPQTGEWEVNWKMAMVRN